MSKIRIVCSKCGSDDIRRDAYATFDTESQEWELSSIYDNFVCESCGGECSVEEVPLDAYTEEEWQAEVRNGDTKLGYDKWVLHKAEADES